MTDVDFMEKDADVQISRQETLSWGSSAASRYNNP